MIPQVKENTRRIQALELEVAKLEEALKLQTEFIEKEVLPALQRKKPGPKPKEPYDG